MMELTRGERGTRNLKHHLQSSRNNYHRKKWRNSQQDCKNKWKCWSFVNVVNVAVYWTKRTQVRLYETILIRPVVFLLNSRFHHQNICNLVFIKVLFKQTYMKVNERNNFLYYHLLIWLKLTLYKPMDIHKHIES